MRFLKVLILVVAIFLALVFLFQNQTALSQDMVLTLNLFFTAPMSSIPLPFYFLLIAAFALGALLSVCFLVWDKMHGTARFMKARWRISQLEREVASLQKQLAAEGKKQSFFQRVRQSKKEDAPAAAEKPANAKPLETVNKEAETAAPVEDIVAPDPDKP